jgi:hypothetical protein
MDKLQRGLTNVALKEVLEGEDKLASLVEHLDASVDGDVLIDAIQLVGKADPLVLRPYFHTAAPIGPLGKLAQKIFLFMTTEKEMIKLEEKEKKKELNEEKRAAHRAAIEAERVVVAPAVLSNVLKAEQAVAEMETINRAEKKRKQFEEKGHIFTLKVPVDAPSQPQFAYYLENQEACIKLVDGKVLSSSREVDASSKKKKGGSAKVVIVQRIEVPGSFLEKLFTERKKENMSLRLFEPEGPFSSPFFMALVCKHRKESTALITKKAASTSSAVLQKERDKAVADVAAKGAKYVASAQRTVMLRLGDVELLSSAASDAEKAQKQVAVQQARAIVKREEQKAEVELRNEEAKWDKLMELSVAAEKEKEAKAARAKDAVEKALKRKADLVHQATRSVQEDVLRNAAKRGRGASTTDVDGPSATEEVPAPAAAADGPSATEETAPAAAAADAAPAAAVAAAAAPTTAAAAAAAAPTAAAAAAAARATAGPAAAADTAACGGGFPAAAVDGPSATEAPAPTAANGLGAAAETTAPTAPRITVATFAASLFL